MFHVIYFASYHDQASGKIASSRLIAGAPAAKFCNRPKTIMLIKAAKTYGHKPIRPRSNHPIFGHLIKNKLAPKMALL
jgi:hypothetical protein